MYVVVILMNRTQKWLIIIYYLFIYSVNIKPSRHRFGFSLAWDWQYIYKLKEHMLLRIAERSRK